MNQIVSHLVGLDYEERHAHLSVLFFMMSLSPNDKIPVAILQKLHKSVYGADGSFTKRIFSSSDGPVIAASSLCRLGLLEPSGEMGDGSWFWITAEVQRGLAALFDRPEKLSKIANRPTPKELGLAATGCMELMLNREKWIAITRKHLTDYIASPGIKGWVVPHLTHVTAVEVDGYLRRYSEEEYALRRSERLSELLSQPSFADVHWRLALARVFSVHGLLEQALAVFKSQMEMQKREDGSNITDLLLIQELCLPLSELHRRREEYDDAIEALRFGLHHERSYENTVIGDAYLQLAELHELRDSNGEKDQLKSLVYSYFALTNYGGSNRRNQAKVALRVGIAQFSVEPSAKGTEESLGQAAAWFSESPERTEEEARALLYLAAVYRSRGDKSNTIEFLMRSLRVYQALRPERAVLDWLDVCIQSCFYILRYAGTQPLALSTPVEVQSGIKQLLAMLESSE